MATFLDPITKKHKTQKNLVNKINLRLVSFLAKAGERQRDGIKGVAASLSHYEVKVLNDMLQEKCVVGLVSIENADLNNCERIGVVVLVQILSREFHTTSSVTR